MACSLDYNLNNTFLNVLFTYRVFVITHLVIIFLSHRVYGARVVPKLARAERVGTNVISSQSSSLTL